MAAATIGVAMVLGCDTSPLTGTETGNDTPPETPAPKPPPDPAADQSDVSLLIYFYADAGQANRSDVTAVLNQLEAVPLTSDTAALALADFGGLQEGGQHGATASPEGVHLYRIRPDEDPAHIGSPRVEQDDLPPELRHGSDGLLGNPESLRALLGYGERLYRADRWVLVLWNAGGMAEPESDGSSQRDRLTADELSSALTGRTPDIVVLDAPSGGMLEIAYELRDTGTTLLARQPYTPVGTWDYTALGKELLSTADTASTEGLAEALVDALVDSAVDPAGGTLSAIITAQTETVVGALRELSEQTGDALSTSEERNTLRDRLFYEVTEFYRTPGNLNLDLTALATAIADHHPSTGTAAAELAAAVEQAVTASRVHPSAAAASGGLSIHYIPLDAYGFPVAHHESYDAGSAGGLSFAPASGWAPNMAEQGGLLYRLWYQAY